MSQRLDYPVIRAANSRTEVNAFIELVSKQLPSMPKDYVEKLYDTGQQRIICAFDGISLVGGAM